MSSFASSTRTSAAARRLTVIDDAPRRVLAVGAHPDDVDFCAGATLARWASEGSEVTYCVLTDGAAGGHDRRVARDGIAAVRRDEQRAAARAIGARDVVFLHYPDGRLAVTADLRRDLSRVIRTVRPDVVVCQSPQRNWQARVQVNHPDHLAAGEATLCAVYPDARNPFSYPCLLEEGLEPHVVEAVWITDPIEATHVVDVTSTTEPKVAALACHVSQLPRGIATVRRRVEQEAASVAELAGLEPGRLAEAFRVVVTAEVE